MAYMSLHVFNKLWYSLAGIHLRWIWYTVYSIHMFDNVLDRKDQKMDAAGEFDDEPEVLESVEVCC